MTLRLLRLCPAVACLLVVGLVAGCASSTKIATQEDEEDRFVTYFAHEDLAGLNTLLNMPDVILVQQRNMPVPSGSAADSRLELMIRVQGQDALLEALVFSSEEALLLESRTHSIASRGAVPPRGGAGARRFNATYRSGALLVTKWAGARNSIVDHRLRTAFGQPVAR